MLGPARQSPPYIPQFVDLEVIVGNAKQIPVHFAGIPGLPVLDTSLRIQPGEPLLIFPIETQR
jgi:hypothetical protein